MKILLVVFLATLLAGCGNLVKGGAIIEAQQALDEGDYQQVLEDTDIASSFGDNSREDRSRIHYLRGQALEGLDRPDEAVHEYRYVADQLDDTPYAARSSSRLKALDEAQ